MSGPRSLLPYSLPEAGCRASVCRAFIVAQRSASRDTMPFPTASAVPPRFAGMYPVDRPCGGGGWNRLRLHLRVALHAGSALPVFEELELWDSLIVCYQMLGKGPQVHPFQPLMCDFVCSHSLFLCVVVSCQWTVVRGHTAPMRAASESSTSGRLCVAGAAPTGLDAVCKCAV